VPLRWWQRIKIETHTGAAVTPLLPDLARLRVEVFRDFPYLYDGDAAYEQGYLQVYANTPGAAVIVARDEKRIVGASTCLPLAAEMNSVQKPFLDAGMDVRKIFYFGESVLEAPYRGRGIGVSFFQAREAQATGYEMTAFCAVNRPDDHPLRPKNYVNLHEFWRHRGYRLRPELVCSMAWRDVGEAAPTTKTLQFWTKDL
jgi:GNAT superfamily N-acetyltransferase